MTGGHAKVGLHWGRCGVWGCRNNHIGNVLKVARLVQGVRYYQCTECGEYFCSEHAGRDPRVPRGYAMRSRRFMRCPKCSGRKRVQGITTGSPGRGL
jgi:hypothetical protein